MTALTRLSQDLTNPNSSMYWGRAHDVLLLAEELLAIDGCWERGSQFSSWIQP